MSEEQPLLQHDDDVEGQPKEKRNRRERVAEKLQTRGFHLAVILLISLDSIIVLVDLSYTFLSRSCTPEDLDSPLWLDILSHISLVITVIFLIELLTFTWAFGPRYYSPFQSILHFCDGSIIVTTFIVEVILKGRERELASLLILFRLLRFAAEAAVGVGELNEGTADELEEVKKALAEKTQQLQDAQREIQTLRARNPVSSDDA